MNIDFNICSNCSDEIQNCASFENYDKKTISLCEKCLIEAVLMIRPIKIKHFNGGDMIQYLEVLKKYNIDKGENGKYINDMQNFIDWLKPFLEGK